MLGDDVPAGIHVATVRESGAGFDLAIDGVCEARLAPLGPPLRFPDLDASQTLCTLSGRDAHGTAFAGYGCVSRSGPPSGSLSLRRTIWAAFGDDLVLAAVAERAAGSAGHGAERIAGVIAQGAPIASSPRDPARLSTTYGQDGLVLRVGLEFGLPESDGDDTAPEGSVGRTSIAGQSIATAVLAQPGGARTEIAFLDWHTGGRGGVGCYLLERFAG